MKKLPPKVLIDGLEEWFSRTDGSRNQWNTAVGSALKRLLGRHWRGEKRGVHASTKKYHYGEPGGEPDDRMEDERTV